MRAQLVSLLLVLSCCVFAQADLVFQENFDALQKDLAPALKEKIPAEVLGWTHKTPEGWAIDTTAMSMETGMPEWRGWSFTTMDFWVSADNQGRSGFTLAENVFAVADSDEYDDLDSPGPFDSTLISPPITLAAGKNAWLCWENISWKIKGKSASLLLSINGGADQLLVDYSPRHLSNVEEVVEIPAPDTGEAWTLVAKWRYRAKNGWFWGIDDVRVYDAAPPSVTPLAPLAAPSDWPTYRKDPQRSGITQEALDFPLVHSWTHSPRFAPQAAWPPPANADVSHRVAQLSPTTVYDRAYHVSVCAGRIYYGSSADDTIYCLEAASGQEDWRFHTMGPVRLSPTVTDGKVYAGSDDGCVYCLDAVSGELIWRFQAGPEASYLPGNGRMISRYPIRTGVMVVGENVYFAAGLFPKQGVFLYAVHADTGELLFEKPVDVSAQGYLLTSSDSLFIPTGRTAPAAYRRKDGKKLGGFEGLGGAFALVLNDMLVHGPSEKNTLQLDTPRTREKIISAPGLGVIAQGNTAYMLQKSSIMALDRASWLTMSQRITQLESIKKEDRSEAQQTELVRLSKDRRKCRLWKVACVAPRDFILAGEALIVGGDDYVAAFATADGAELWRAKTEAKVYGLAVSDKRLYVSLDSGAILCFGAETGSPQKTTIALQSETVSIDDTLVESLKVLEKGQGYLFLLGVGDGQLARHLAATTHYQLIVVESDAVLAQESRRRFAQLGLLGSRITVHSVEGNALPYPAYCANVILCEANLQSGNVPRWSYQALERLQQPYGGLILMNDTGQGDWGAWSDGALKAQDGLLIAQRGPLEGAGEWTHPYATPGNTACSLDTRVGLPVAMQWFGAPGPNRMYDRHFRNLPPLFKDGRFFVEGDNIIYGVDAYNGTPLWTTEIPEARRLGVFLDAGNMAVTDRGLYIAAGGACIQLDPVSGAIEKRYAVPESPENLLDEWGYLAAVEGLIFGSARASGTAFQDMTREANFTKQALWYPNMRVATSGKVFAYDAASGALAWHYTHGRILDATLTVGEGKVFFVATTNPKLTAQEKGRFSVRELFAEGEQVLVALEAATGKVLYQRAVDISAIEQPTYLNFAHGTILVSGARLEGPKEIKASGYVARQLITGDEKVFYNYYAFDAATGELRWTKEHLSELRPDGGHGEYNRHPTIVDEVVYAWPYAYNLKTGEQVEGWKFDRRGHGCGGIAASAHSLFWRGNNPWMFDLSPGGGPSRLTQATRPGCWINIIPAGGLILIPEASSGCTCGYSIQTTLAFAPKAD